MHFIYSLFFMIAFAACTHAQIKNISANEALSLLKNKKIVFLDVRTEAEVKESYIPNSVHIDVLDERRFTQEVKKLDKQSTYVIYCRTGRRSITAAEIMRQQGFLKVMNLKEGILGWNGPILNK